MNKFFLLFFIPLISLGQLDSDYLDARKRGDFCFRNKDFECAKRLYENALAVKTNDVYCTQQINIIKEKEIQRRKNREEKIRLSQNNPRTQTTTNNNYYGKLKGLINDEDEKFDYEGLISNNQPNGQGTAYYGIYDKTSGQEFGNWVKGKKNGFFKAIYPNGDRYEAFYKNNLLDGEAKYYEKNTLKTHFVFKNGKYFGNQKIFDEGITTEIQSENGKLEGQFKWQGDDGKLFGYITEKGEFLGDYTLIYKNGDKIIGKLDKANGFHGNVVVFFANGDRFEGNFNQSKPNGLGKLYQNDSTTIEGYFEADYAINGKAIVKYNNGDIYEGRWKDNYENGFGKIIYKEGGYYEGNWLNGKYNGFGTFETPIYKTVKNCMGTILYKGEWKSDLKDGQGECFNRNGELLYSGRFKNDFPTDKYPSKKKRK